MKLSLVALAATFAVASAVDCDLVKVSPLLADPNVATCTADSGFSFTDLSKLTAESMPKLCASTACNTVLTTVKGLGLGDCTLLGMKLETDLLTPIMTACASGSTAGSAAGSSAGGATVGSSTPTKSDSKTSTGSSSGGASASTVDTPAANSTTTTPAPTTKSSASSVVMAASAAVVAIVAAFF